jgi:hypothetical protein
MKEYGNKLYSINQKDAKNLETMEWLHEVRTGWFPIPSSEEEEGYHVQNGFTRSYLTYIRWFLPRGKCTQSVQLTTPLHWNIQCVQPRRKPGRERGAGTTFLPYRCCNCRWQNEPLALINARALGSIKRMERFECSRIADSLTSLSVHAHICKNTVKR